MRLTGHDVLKFDAFMPIYNWIYPLAGQPSKRFGPDRAVQVFLELPTAQSRALYVHIPFCETICTFCPFVRGKYQNESVIDVYVEALLSEIELKGRFRALTEVPVGAVFFGGGTPSILKPHHIRKLGKALGAHFDLSRLREFSFEFEVKSVTPERIEALLDIGVTHARFGLQTFSPEYRQLFELTATIDDIYSATKLLSDSFPYLSCDLLYGMNGQSEDDLLADIERVCELNIGNIDFYPINNLVTQHKLHQSFRDVNKQPVSGLTKFYMRLLLREALREKGFLPHNGHGWVRAPEDEIRRNPVVTDVYSFVYHEHVLGYPKHDLLGFGTNAVSSFTGFSVSNTPSRDDYIRALSSGELPMKVSEHDEAVDACRPIALALPYHGSVDRRTVDWDCVPSIVIDHLEELEQHKLVTATETEFGLTRLGWEWYTSVMYYLLPDEEQSAIRTILGRAARDKQRDIEASGLEEFPFTKIERRESARRLHG